MGNALAECGDLISVDDDVTSIVTSPGCPMTDFVYSNNFAAEVQLDQNNNRPEALRRCLVATNHGPNPTNNDITAFPSSSAISTASVSNVTAEIHSHRDKAYMDALRNCCIHTLRGATTCNKPKVCQGQNILCKQYHSGLCPFTGLQHGAFLHIKRSCRIALEDNDCFEGGCTYGHDNLNLRRERSEQAKKNAEAGKAANNNLIESAAYEQIETLKGTMGSKKTARNTTARERSIAADTARKLGKKLRSLDGEKKVLNGGLRAKVYVTLKLYNQWTKQ